MSIGIDNGTEYRFVQDFNSKKGLIKKDTVLTGRKSSSTGKFMFDFYEKTDPEKTAAGEGVFSLTPDEVMRYTRLTITPEKTTIIQEPYSKRNVGFLLGGAIGFTGGLAYAFHKKTGFWKGLGIVILFNMAGHTLGYAIDYAINQNKKNGK